MELLIAVFDLWHQDIIQKPSNMNSSNKFYRVLQLSNQSKTHCFHVPKKPENVPGGHTEQVVLPVTEGEVNWNSSWHLGITGISDMIA